MCSSRGWRPHAGETDKHGLLIDDRIYNVKDFDRSLIIDTRTQRVARWVTDYLKQSGSRMQKTIMAKPSSSWAPFGTLKPMLPESPVHSTPNGHAGTEITPNNSAFRLRPAPHRISAAARRSRRGITLLLGDT